MNRLVAFGCSNTYGYGLKDCPLPLGVIGKSSKLAWPQILSKHLNRVCVNLSNPGASLREVVHRIQTTKFKKSDIVVVMFPPAPRSCVITLDPTVDPTGKDRIEKYGDWRIKQIFINRDVPTDLDKIWISHFADEYHINLDYLTLSNYIYLFLKHKNIKSFFFSAMNAVKIHNTIKNSIQDDVDQVPIFYPGIYQIAEAMNDYALDNDHPGEQAHKAFADRAFQYICQNT